MILLVSTKKKQQHKTYVGRCNDQQFDGEKVLANIISTRARLPSKHAISLKLKMRRSSKEIFTIDSSSETFEGT